MAYQTQTLSILRKDETVLSIRNNDMIQDVLPVVIVMSNPCRFKKRAQLAREFIQRMTHEPHVSLYVVELVFGDKNFQITQRENPNHLQLRAHVPLWHKENLVNIAVRRLLPSDWKCFAWIDADIIFESPTWAQDTLKILNGDKDIVQLWSHCDDMDASGHTMKMFQSFAHQYTLGRVYHTGGVNLWHPGYAWAMTREAYEKIGGLYDLSILGSGDHNMAMAIVGYMSLNPKTTEGYRESLTSRLGQFTQMRIGYVPGVIRHCFHGSKKNRQYSDRWKILVKHEYDPYKHVMYREDGLLIPTTECPRELLEDIMRYFHERNEDEK